MVGALVLLAMGDLVLLGDLLLLGALLLLVLLGALLDFEAVTKLLFMLLLWLTATLVPETKTMTIAVKARRAILVRLRLK